MAGEGDTRTLTVSWEDPMAVAIGAVEMSGMEVLDTVLRGDMPVPPLLTVLGIRPVEHEEGRAVLTVDLAEQHSNNGGFVAHGGLAATLIDSAAWLALHSTMPPKAFCSTAQMSINYVRPLKIGSNDVRAEGRIVHRGRKAATAEATVTDGEGLLCAQGTITCLIIEA